MSWDLKCTITVDENQVKELADGLGNKYAITIEELSKENNEIMESRGALQRENTELKKEIQELREKLSKSHEEAKQAVDLIFYFLKRFGSTIEDIAKFEIHNAVLQDLRAKYR